LQKQQPTAAIGKEAEQQWDTLLHSLNTTSFLLLLPSSVN
jgi:hypothetical protein